MGFIDKLKQFFAGLEEKSIKQTESMFGSDVRRLADYMDSAKEKAESRISSTLESRLSSTLQPRSTQPAAEKPTQTTAQKASAPAPQKPNAAPAPKKNRTLPEGYSVVKKMAMPTYWNTGGIFYLDDKITGYYARTRLTNSDSSVNKSHFESLCAFVKELGYDANSIAEQHSGGKRMSYSKRFDIVFAEIMKDFPGIAGIRNKSSYLGKDSDGTGFFILNLYDEIQKHEFEYAVRALHYLKKPFEYDKSQPLEQSVRELDAFIRSNGLLK